MDKKHLAEIGHRLRQRRSELKLTREEFAERADISPGYYGQLEVGTSQMSIDTLIKVARVARLPLETILFGADYIDGSPSPIISILNECDSHELRFAEELLKLCLLRSPFARSDKQK